MTLNGSKDGHVGEFEGRNGRGWCNYSINSKKKKNRKVEN